LRLTWKEFRTPELAKDLLVADDGSVLANCSAPDCCGLSQE